MRNQERRAGLGLINGVRMLGMSDLELQAKLNAERSEIPIWSRSRKEPSSPLTTSEDMGLPVDETPLGSGRQIEDRAEFRQILDLAPQHIGVFGPNGSPLYLNQVGPIRVGLRPLIHGQGLALISFIRRIVNILSVKERRDFSRVGLLSTRLGY